MQLFYNPNINETTESFSFDKEESKHIIKVMRKKGGDILFVTNGLGFLFKTEIVLGSDIKCTVKIVSIEKSEQPKYHLHLAVAPTKMNDRYEWFLEKATEIGIDEITPIICERSERKEIKTDRSNKIITSAVKQSLKAYHPKLNHQITFKEFIKQAFADVKYIAHCDDFDRQSISLGFISHQNYLILIGPEGDFSPSEIEFALQNGFVPITLGTSRLRTETAALQACFEINYLNR